MIVRLKTILTVVASLAVNIPSSARCPSAGSGLPPDPPVLAAPEEGAVLDPAAARLEVTVSDPESDALTVRFFARKVGADEDDPFSIVFIPDTQYYTSQLYGGSISTFQDQARWIAGNAGVLNIAHVIHAGDCVQYGDSDRGQWERSWTAMGMLEDPDLTGRPEGIPYIVCVGDNDQTPEGDADGSTEWHDAFYGPGHFDGKPWYGGCFRGKGDNQFVLFSAGGRDLISIVLEYDKSQDADVLAWADSLLKAYPDRWGIVSSHHILDTGDPAAFSWQGNNIYLKLYDNPNLVLMLSGHVPGEGRRSFEMGGRWLHALMADYQARPNGGDGWMRVMTYFPSSRRLGVKTYSPLLDRYEADADSSSAFTLPLELAPAAHWRAVAEAAEVLSGSAASVVWNGLEEEAEYEWYAEADDGSSVTRSETWRFGTGVAGDAAGTRVSIGLVTGNPVAAAAVFAFDLPEPSWVRVTVHDALGRLVDTVVSGSFSGGRHEAEWGAARAPGVYFVRIDACGESVSMKAVLLR